jgi:acyl-CoA synthetase (AMP-forming)/AMP-acid ligase II
MLAALVHQFLEASAQRRPEHVFLVHEAERASYGEVEAAANRVARALVGLGVARGDRVALLAQNSRFYVESYYGILKAGAIAVPLNTAADAATLAKLLAGCGAKLLVCGPRLERLAGAACAAVSGCRLSTAAELATASASESPEPLALPLSGSDTASIIYTSGSTGVPQGATLTHGALVANTRSIVSYLELVPEDRVLSLLPFYYVYGKSLLNTHACAGGSLAIENRFLYPNVALDTLEREACTGLSGVPSTFAILLNRSSFAERKMPSLRYVTQAGGAMSPEHTKRLVAALPGRKVFIMYGATEAGARLSYLPPERVLEKLGSIGIAIPGVELRVLDPAGRELPPGEVGELVARGPNLMTGYWGDPESTARALDAHGYHTGDLAYRDADGFFFITGRSKDIIKAGAHRISAKEIEEAIAALPEVHETAVIGVPDEILGEKIKAFVVLREGAAVTGDDLAKSLRAKLPAYKLPAEIALVADLPKNESGKIMKRELR